MTLGIGIITYNRLEHLKQVLPAVFTYTTGPFRLVIADDGSTDGTREYAEAAGVTVVGEDNAGIAWNKNRALYTLAEEAKVDSIILLEDDTMPVELGWEQLWISTIRRFAYATYAHPKIMSGMLAGSGTPEDPYACLKITSQCSAVTRRALNKVGYFDTRFKGYGVEDGEWTSRIRRIGGGLIKVPEGEGYQKCNVMITGGLETLDSSSYRNNDSVRRNRELQAQIGKEPIPRPAWRTDAEEVKLKGEVASALARQPLATQQGRPRPPAPAGTPS